MPGVFELSLDIAQAADTADGAQQTLAASSMVLKKAEGCAAVAHGIRIEGTLCGDVAHDACDLMRCQAFAGEEIPDLRRDRARRAVDVASAASSSKHPAREAHRPVGDRDVGGRDRHVLDRLAEQTRFEGIGRALAGQSIEDPAEAADVAHGAVVGPE